MEQINNLFVQFFWMIISFFLYERISAKSHLKKEKGLHQLLIFLLAGLCLVISMSLPMRMPPYRIDLRAVPLLIGSLYGGYRVGLGLLLVFTIFRVYSGSFHMLHSFLTLICFIPAIVAFMSVYSTKTKSTKLNIVFLLTLYYSTLVILPTYLLGGSEVWNNKQIIPFFMEHLFWRQI